MFVGVKNVAERISVLGVMKTVNQIGIECRAIQRIGVASTKSQVSACRDAAACMTYTKDRDDWLKLAVWLEQQVQEGVHIG